MSGSSMVRRCLVSGAGAVVLAGAVSGVAVAGHKGKISPLNESHRDATRLAQTVVVSKGLLSGRWAALPPDNHPAAISTEPLAGFPRFGKAYGIITTGCSTLADHGKGAGLPGCRDQGVPFRGTRDLSIFRIVLRVPKSANCLSFRFRFLSQEFPQFVGSQYNDGFIAELDQTTWNSGASGDPNDPHIAAPRDFAKDSQGNIVSINSASPATFSKAAANGTTYGGGTPVLRASTPIKPGVHSLFLSIFDQGDRQYDSAVFFDQLTVNHRASCVSGLATTK